MVQWEARYDHNTDSAVVKLLDEHGTSSSSSSYGCFGCTSTVAPTGGQLKASSQSHKRMYWAACLISTIAVVIGGTMVSVVLKYSKIEPVSVEVGSDNKTAERANIDVDYQQYIAMSGTLLIDNWNLLEAQDPVSNLANIQLFCDVVSLVFNGSFVKAGKPFPKMVDCYVLAMTPVPIGSGVLLSFVLKFSKPLDWNPGEVIGFKKLFASALKEEMISGQLFNTTDMQARGNSLEFNDGNLCLYANCSQLCERLPWDYKCICHSGYLLGNDDSICVDIDECLAEDSACSGNYTTCVNTAGSFLCPCMEGFQRNGTDQDCHKICPAGYERTGDVCTALAVVCSSNEWQCNEGSCIDTGQLCNGISDCVDSSDESNCPSNDVTECLFYEWRCENGRCISSSYVCDGDNDCFDNSDELECSKNVDCLLKNSKACSNGSCIALRLWCDGTVDCLDGSDESNCDCDSPYDRKCDDDKCFGPFDRCNFLRLCDDGADEIDCDCSEYSANKCGDRCLQPRQICDGKIDCDDRSDEIGCDCSEGSRFKCGNGICIQTVFVCNKIDDCTDGTDERNCSYCEEDGHFLCPSDLRCVPSFAVCDGADDCLFGEEETNCPCWGEFHCSKDECVPMSQMCDGVADCSGEEDEKSCIRLEPQVFASNSNQKLLLLAHQGAWYPVCSSVIPDNVTGGICTAHEHRFPDNLLGINITKGWMQYKGHGFENPTQSFNHVSVCPGNLAVFLRCQETPTKIECGRRSPYATHNEAALIIGGRSSNEGMWPWQVQIYSGCGGSIISPDYIVTAAHCVRGFLGMPLPADYFAIKVGSNRRNGNDRNTKEYSVVRVIGHPLYDSLTNGNDIALLRVNERIAYSDHVRPLCVTPANQDNIHQSQCYVTGWGRYNFVASPNDLREMRINLLPPTVCERHLHDMKRVVDNNTVYVVNDQMICGFQSLADTCYGDSGGPLSCRQPDGRFELVGIVSWGSSPFCQSYAVFTNVSHYVGWIEQETGLTLA